MFAKKLASYALGQETNINHQLLTNFGQYSVINGQGEPSKKKPAYFETLV